jgi:hypothetical protein
MNNNIQEWRQAEKLPEVVSQRRTALGRGLRALMAHHGLRTAGLRARVLREEPLPPGMPSWAKGWFHKVCRKGRKV